MATKKATTANPADHIAELVERRNHLLELRDLTEAAPRSLAEAQADVPKVIELLRSRCEPQSAWIALGPRGYVDLERQLSHQDVDYQPIPAAALLAWCAPDVLAAAIERDLAASYDALPLPMTSAAKATELARLAREIATVETEIAAAWWVAADGGLSLPVPDIDGGRLIGLAD